MPNTLQRSYLRTHLLLKIHKSDGSAFQDFFTELMRKHNPEFRTIKPHGSHGDGGNDGFVANEGRYFQVYSPEKPQEKITEAIKKAQNDFGKLLEKWEPTCEIRNYHFVFNDKEKGAYPAIETALATIKKDHKLDEASPFYAQHVERIFWELSDEDKFELLGLVSLPDPEELEAFEFLEFTELLQHLMESPTSALLSTLGKVPDFSEKVQFNGLSDAVGRVLEHGSYQQGFIEDYFERIPNDFTRKDVRDRLRAIYLQQVEEIGSKISDEVEAPGDLVFFALLEQITPQDKIAIGSAAISLIAYYFEKCDVFEDPNL